MLVPLFFSFIWITQYGDLLSSIDYTDTARDIYRMAGERWNRLLARYKDKNTLDTLFFRMKLKKHFLELKKND